MKVDPLLAKLQKVKRTSRESWVACCPAHADKSPSLSIRETADGRVLIHCFAGCEPLAVLEAVGMAWQDVMPERLTDAALAPLRQRFPAADVLECVADEALIAAVCAAKVRRGEALSQADADRLLLATERLGRARSMANG